MTVIHVEVNETWISEEQVCFVCAVHDFHQNSGCIFMRNQKYYLHSEHQCMLGWMVSIS